ncbi:MAG TPA: hypothetical protein VGS57_05270 [Thermoanaerobaculia bacterium]|nr:hypothetical protein [Thermoanaerobaculia bacterium]
MSDLLGNRVRRAVQRYGRVGLLVDDSPRANHRVAREMYGAESLPDWWVVARSQQCAEDALKAMAALPPDPRIPSLILIDRYLPLKCDDQNEMPWDDSRLDTLTADSRASHRAFFSSYPFANDGDGASRLHWQPRDSETIVRLRRTVEAAAQNDPSQWSLLRFAPDEWRKPIASLIKKLATETTGRTERMVLLTGAGASVAESAFSPGMPLTPFLLSSALSTVFLETKKIREGQFPRIMAAQFPAAPDCCRVPEPAGEVPQAAPPGVTEGPLQRALRELLKAHRLGDDWWRLTDLVSVEKNPGFEAEVNNLLPTLNRSMLRYDRDFPSVHWYFAHLPWDRIVTTNFDTYHERASQQAVALWRRRPPTGLEPRQGLGYSDKGLGDRELATVPLLRKPYGSLAHPEILAWTDTELADSEERFGKAFEKLDSIWLVVVGHSVRDVWIADWIRANANSGRIVKIFWVDKQAKRESSRAGNSWDALLKAGRVECLEGRAVEFAHDLFMQYWQARVP